MRPSVRVISCGLIAAWLALPAAAAARVVDWRTALAEGNQRLAAHDLPGAEAYFRQAVVTVRIQRPHTTDDVARCLQSLGAVLQEQDNTEDAVPLYKRAVAIERRAHGKRSPELIPPLVALGKIYENEGEYRKSLQFLHCALVIEPANNECRYLIGRVSYKNGDLVAAEQCYDAVLASLMAQPELSSTQLLEDVLSDYLQLYRSCEPGRNLASRFQSELLKDQLDKLQMTQAIPPSHFSREVSARLAADSSPIVTDVVGTAKGAVSEQLRPIKSGEPVQDFVALEPSDQQRVSFYERMIATDINSLGPKHPSVARDLSGLAAVYLSQKKYEDAKTMLSRALTIYRTIYGDEALLSRRTVALLSLIDEEQQDALRVASAPPLEWLKLVPVVPLQTGKLEISLAFNYLALLAYSHGKIDDAARFYAWALADTVLATGQTSPLTAACLSDYGKVLRSCGQIASADSFALGARRILRELKTKEAVLAIP